MRTLTKIVAIVGAVAAVNIAAFFAATTDTIQKGVFEVNDNFRGAYRKLALEPTEFPRNIGKNNITEYWTEYHGGQIAQGTATAAVLVPLYFVRRKMHGESEPPYETR